MSYTVIQFLRFVQPPSPLYFSASRAHPHSDLRCLCSISSTYHTNCTDETIIRTVGHVIPVLHEHRRHTLPLCSWTCKHYTRAQTRKWQQQSLQNRSQ